MAEYEPRTDTGKCVFCEIVAENLETPGIFWENDLYLAFLSIDPNTPGFTCVIPKNHFSSDILKMNGAALCAFVLAAKKVAAILEAHFDSVGRVGLIMEGTGIDHAHIKLVPMHGTELLKDGKWTQMPSGRSDWFETYQGWMSSAGGPMANPKELKNLAQSLKQGQKK